MLLAAGNAGAVRIARFGVRVGDGSHPGAGRLTGSRRGRAASGEQGGRRHANGSWWLRPERASGATMIDRDTIDRIRDQTSIAAVIGESIKLRKRGRNHIGLCPFHQEKTPSFNVDDERGFYHCFGCGASGDVFRFMEQHGGLSFAEAVRRLAERAGIPIQETTSEPERRREDEARRRRQELLDVASSAVEFFVRTLEDHESAQGARTELARWGLVPSSPPDPVASTLTGFKVGYAPPQADALVTHLRQSGLSLRAAESLGLLVRDADTGQHRDRFRHRLVLPVLDLHGRAVAFLARRLDPVDVTLAAEAPQESLVFGEQHDRAVQLASPESAVYAPRASVFGLHQARQSLRSSGQCVVVPEPIDVLCMHAHGFENAVAILGPSVTPEQVRLVKRFTERVTFLFVADPSGVRGVVEAGGICRREELLVSLAPVPDDRGPAAVLAGPGAVALQGVLAAARGLPEYLIDRALGSPFLTDDATTRVARLRAVTRLLQNESDPLVRAMAEQYADRVVQRLGVQHATTLRALDALVQRELKDVRRAAAWPADDDALRVAESTAQPLVDQLGRELLGAVLDQPELLADDEVVGALQFAEGETAAAIAAARRSWNRESGLDADGLLARVAPVLREFTQGRLARPQHRDVELAKSAVLAAAHQLAQSSTR